LRAKNVLFTIDLNINLLFAYLFPSPLIEIGKLTPGYLNFKSTSFFYLFVSARLRFSLAFPLEKGTIAAGHAQSGIVIRIMIDLICFVFCFYFK